MRLVAQKKPDFDTLKRQLHSVLDAMEELGVPYHLEGGTLLGIVRDGDILPWDKDTDISIMREDAHRLPELYAALAARHWRLSLRRYMEEKPYCPAGEIRLIKVKGRKMLVLPDEHMLDIFVKTRHEGHVWWQAVRHTLRVDEHHYDGFELVEWEGRKVRAPLDYKAYLTAKYGDWSKPVKEWTVDMEQTIVS